MPLPLTTMTIDACALALQLMQVSAQHALRELTQAAQPTLQEEPAAKAEQPPEEVVGVKPKRGR